MILRLNSNTTTLTAMALCLSTFAGAAGAAGTHSGGHGEESSMPGMPGEPAKADRTIEIIMTDNDYSLSEIIVEEGETIRFIIRNEGDFLHEFNIGTPQMHMMHQKEMIEMMEKGMMDGMHMMGEKDHDDPNSLLLESGDSGELTWTFGDPMKIEFACNVPGHYEDGMVGPLTVTPHGH
ncbi:MAG: cupredoxin domain-containing protein [Paracoccaceae bacterium]|nr:cupredoxin domain-containing protein [Paracoccaceae bacterium]